jgi:secreted trypsin-like serine protease
MAPDLRQVSRISEWDRTFLCILGFILYIVAARAAAVTLSAQLVTGSAPYREAAQAWVNHDTTLRKIVGGAPAPAGSFPWQVSLEVSWIPDPLAAHFCGGTVYSDRWIVTAAHCVTGNDPKDIIVTAGTHSLGVGGVRRSVNRVLVKANYDARKNDNDIALLELFDPLPLGPTIAILPVLSLAEENSVLDVAAAPLAVSGWGATVVGGKAVRDLRYVEIPFVERSECNRPLAYDGAITENMICAGAMAGGRDSCQGDSGGPLTARTGERSLLAGVVSWGEGCAAANKVGVYTRAANFAAWIASCVANATTCQ